MVALADALQILGIGLIYHMRETIRDGHKAAWNRLLLKREAGDTVDKEDLDRLPGDFGGTTDIPTAFFVDELLAAYPDAHIIHMTRTEESWLASMRRTLWAGQQGNLAKIARDEPLDELAATYWRCYWENDFGRTGPANWKAREQTGERLGKQIEEEQKNGGKRSFVVMALGDGWEKLCGMLGVDVPRDETGQVLDWPNHDDHRK